MNRAEFQKLVKTERNEYARAWRRKNPDKVKAANERYWEKRVKNNLAKRGE